MRQELSLLPIDLTLKFPRALTAAVQLTFQTAAGAAIDIAGDTVTLIVRDRIGGTQMFTEDAVLTNAAGGIATLTIAAADLTPAEDEPLTQWVYLITRTHAGVVVGWWGGNFEIHKTAL